ncbi:FIVAR domain-containing protein [Bifidobacterium callimiconis]|nr:FIVAR domain-containing protein [Bifidobacterium callimiconis]
MVSDRPANEAADSPTTADTAVPSATSAIHEPTAVNAPSTSPANNAVTDDAVANVPTVVADSNTSAVDVPATVTEAPTMVFSPSALADAAAEAAAKNGARNGVTTGAGAKSTAPKSTSEWLYPDDAKAASARHGGDLVDTSWGIEPIQFPASVTGADDTDVDATKPFGDLPQFAGPASGPDDDLEHRDKPALAALAGTGFADDMVDEEKPEEKKKSPWLIVAIVVAILVVIGLVVGVFVYWNSLKKDGAHSDAMTQCIAANNRVTIANDKLSKALSSTKDAQGIAGDQVADANTVSTLKTAVEEAGNMGKAKSCTYLASTEQLTAAAKDNSTLASKLEKSVKSLTAAAKAVTDSKQQKEIDTAKQQLQDLVATAQQTMTDSEGEVSDESTRTALQSAIDSANGVLANTDATVDDLNKAKTDLQSAVDAVTASMDEYQAALKAQQQKESSSDSDSNGSSNSNSNSGTTKRNSGSTTRRTTSPSTTHRNTTSPSPSTSSSSPSTTTTTSPGNSGTEGSTDNSGSGNGSGNGSGGSSTDGATGGTSGNGTTDNGTNSNNSGKTTTSN